MDDQCAGSLPPETQEQQIARLMRFYNVGSLEALVEAQDKHIEKLQAKHGIGLPSLSTEFGSGRPLNPREG